MADTKSYLENQLEKKNKYQADLYKQWYLKYAPQKLIGPKPVQPQKIKVNQDQLNNQFYGFGPPIITWSTLSTLGYKKVYKGQIVPDDINPEDYV